MGQDLGKSTLLRESRCEGWSERSMAGRGNGAPNHTACCGLWKDPVLDSEEAAARWG